MLLPIYRFTLKIKTGDGLSVRHEQTLSILAGPGAEFILFDLK